LTQKERKRKRMQEYGIETESEQGTWKKEKEEREGAGKYKKKERESVPENASKIRRNDTDDHGAGWTGKEKRMLKKRSRKLEKGKETERERAEAPFCALFLALGERLHDAKGCWMLPY
jgi:hypothetical protein